MAERQTKNSFERSDLLGLALFVPGAFLCVLVVMDWLHSGGGGWTGRLATSVVAALGHVAPLVAALGFGAVGVAVYLRGDRESLGRHGLAVLGTAAGSAVLLGSVSRDAGGALGRASGGWLAAEAGEFLGVLAGLAATVVPVWLFWIRGTGLPRTIPASPAPPEGSPSDSGADGVSSAEAAALVPDERFVSYMEQVWRHTRTTPSARSGPASPYPEDVRRKGQIPPGAKALGVSHAEPSQASSYPAPAEPSFAAPAPGGAYVPLGKDLVAQAAVARDAASDLQADPVTAAPGEAVDRGKAPLGYRTFFGAEPESQARAGRAAATTEPRVPARSPERPPRPTWEESSLLEAGASTSARASGSARSSMTPAAPESGTEPDAPPEPFEEGELGDELESDEEIDALGEECDEDEADDSSEYDEEDEAPEGEDGEDDDEYEFDPEDAEVAELDEEELDDDEEDAEEDEEAEAGDVEDALSGAAGDPRAEPIPLIEASEPEHVLEPHPAPAPRARRGARLAPEPVASAPSSREIPAVHEELVLQAGMLFLQHGRVAVSLLQRHFALDFDQACELLDELQQRGLIGPYLGGQRRDILLSAEQWMERVGTS